MHTSGTASTGVSFSGVTMKNNESNTMYHSANVSTLLIAALELGNLFCTNAGKCPWNGDCLDNQPVSLLFQQANVFHLRTFLWITFSILSMSACFGKKNYI